MELQTEQALPDGIWDVLIEGGEVIDGSKRPRFRADVGVVGDRIVALGDLQGQPARLRIDARGKIVAPGFIDAHTHDDHAVLCQPDMVFKVSQGVTTVVTGNCGISLAPMRAGQSLPAPLNLLGDGSLSFPTFRGYVDALKAQPAAVNVVPMVGHANLRVLSMDDLGHSATAPEVQSMQALLEEALDAGAVGMSTGTYYPPSAAASTDEVIGVSRPLGAQQALYVTHMRNEAEGCMASIEETFAIGEAVDTPVLISHHKLMREPNFGQSTATLARIAEQMQCQCVALDCYPYNASSTMLHLDEARLQGKVVIASSGSHPEMRGKELGDIAALWGVSRAEATARLQPASAIYFSMDEADVQRILAFEPTMIGSDGIPTGEQPHPRLWGTFPRVLGHYSRDVGLFPLETAVWKMTGLTAGVFGLAHRGQVAPGCFADLTVFDPVTVRDRASYDQPKQAAEGIDWVLVNGQPVYQAQACTGARPGRVLARTVAAA